MRIREATRRLGISSDWLKRLERNGVIPPAMRDLAGHRRYSEEDIERLRGMVLKRSVRPLRRAQEPHTAAGGLTNHVKAEDRRV